MNAPRYIFEATPQNFAQLVLANSEKGPVFVNYWSPKAGPCMMLMPRLVKLSDEYAGRFLLVTLNTDEHGRFARDQHGVVSIPMTKVFRHGQIVDTLQGAESEASLRRFIDKHVPRPRAEEVRVVEAYHAGNIDQAASLAAQAALDQPENFKSAVDIAKMLMLSQRYQQAHDLLNALPLEAKAEPEVANLLAHVGFILVAKDAPAATVLAETVAAQPENLEARYQLAAVRLLADEYDEAMAQLLEIAKRDRFFRQDGGYRGLVAIFRLLGEHDLRVRHYRELVQNILH